MPINPIQGSKGIKGSYLSYLETTFPIKDQKLKEQFLQLIAKPERLVKGPILEAMPPFVLGARVSDLIDEGALSPLFMGLPAKELPPGPLWWHQEQAIRKAVTLRRNLVVASGTGSGKTECFLIPILNSLFRELEQGELTPGVRALLLYPMNALANDQLKRLRGLLVTMPDITFGRYTGETKRTEREAMDQYFKMYEKEPLPNEKISRVAMWDEPPHILLTNYAMLEYLLLRPEDNVFFDGPHADSWRFIALDEAHTYTGAKGIEIAMLLRRLKERVVGSEQGRLQCFATSATLGNGKEDAPEIAVFAENLFGEKFEWSLDHETSPQDIIIARRIDQSLSSRKEELFMPEPELYLAWQEAMGQSTGSYSATDAFAISAIGSAGGEVAASSLQAIVDNQRPSPEDLAAVAKGYGIPDDLLASATAGAAGVADRFLYLAMEKDDNLAKLRSRLQEKPMPLEELASELFPERPDADHILVALVDLAVRARLDKDSARLLPARYHLFVKAIEGAYLQLEPEYTLSLERKEVEEIDGKEWPVYEMGTCRNCGHLYLYGRIDPDTSTLQHEASAGEQGTSHYFLVADTDAGTVSEDEDELVLFSSITAKDWQRWILCTSCGRIWRETALVGECSCDAQHRIMLLQAPSGKNVYLCPACGRRNPIGLVFRFFTGQDATATVIATSLYQSQEAGESLWQEQSHPADEKMAQVSDGERPSSRLLVFSDSRQDAAFFAPYLNRTYNQILARALMCRCISAYRDKIVDYEWRTQDLVRPLTAAAREAGLFGPRQSSQEQMRIAWIWLFQEFLRLDRHNSLESLGFLSFRPARYADILCPKELRLPPWNLTEDEAWGVICILLDTLRANGVVTFPKEVEPTDEAFAPRNRKYYMRQYDADDKRKVLAWCPSSSRLNSRLDFLTRLGKLVGAEPAACREMLQYLWDGYFRPHRRDSAWAPYFHLSSERNVGSVYRLRHDMWELDLTGPNEDEAVGWYECGTCGYISRVNVRGVCPNYQCHGFLKPMESLSLDNHYAKLYRTLRPVRLKAEEHTAQLRSDTAARLQTDFSSGDVNVLSCSTTFELGVNLGSLEVVFLRNMPPTPANYVQRAGRAGRRTESAAFVTTFAQRRPHDMEYFRHPKRMVAGIIRPPHFLLANEKIIRRHVYATALAYLWKESKDTYGEGRADDFFMRQAGLRAMTDLIIQRPDELHKALCRIVPGELHDVLDLDGWGWAQGLLDLETGVLVRASDEFEHDVMVLEEILTSLQEQRRPSDHILRALNTVRSRQLVGYLAGRSVLPKYGFPVDSVELKLNSHTEWAERLELERDLRIALSEYAPGSQVVAGGKMWVSRYLRLIPRRTWLCYRFAICDNCGSYERVMADSEEELLECNACGAELDKVRQRGRYVVPEFGFVSESGAPADVPSSRPERYPFPRVHFWGPSLEPDETVRLRVGEFEVQAISAHRGRLAALNTCFGAGFKLCFWCGYAVPGTQKNPQGHKDAYGKPCSGTLQRVSLGHEFETDVLLVYFQGYYDRNASFWPSLLYGLLEGVSLTLDIERFDLDGCLYPRNGQLASPALVLYDNVPGGAGHVRRVANEDVLRDVLEASRTFLSSCECGTSCSGCLRNFRNQYWHDKLNRHLVLDFLSKVLG